MHRHSSLRYLWTLLLGGWLATACTNPTDSKPAGLIEEGKMAEILTEVHMAEARVSRLSLTSLDSSQVAYKHMETQIFKKFGVDTAAYRKSYIFYSSHPANMEVIYKQVTQSLQKKIDAGNAKRSKKP
ncbi:DUF4296 domain-containing protein [Spirosoma luteum]|uniref:DUF4296 domain-containing protein n=1 Tax=Spirosoma luteum TaxID=431553 RepID=UPI0004762B87|nr:DUF4296 domain-containing protein [Spirosoma luteum]